MENVEQTIISQYANSPTLVQLIQNMNQYIDQTANFQAFYDYVWNVNTAQGFGLDVWGRIVGIERQLEVVSPQVYFGFAEAFQGITGAQNSQPFNQAPFYNGKAVTNTFTLGDAAYRQLILAKALANISNLTAPSLNALISKVFSFLPQQGDILGVGKLPFTLYAPAQRAYVQDTGGMQYRVVFEFYPTALQLAIILNSGVFPRPAGVRLQVVEFAPDSTFGFAEAGGTPFGAGTFSHPQESKMQLSSIPSKIAAIFAASGTKNAIPLTTAGVANPNNASMDVGFPPITMLPVPSGGLPPFGADFNGILNAMTAVQQWLNAGGLFPYDAAFSSAIGGYPKGSLLLMASGLGTWRSQVDNNVSNPDTGGANWDQLVNLSQFPSVQGASGSETLPNGLIRKWGQFNGSTGGPTSVTFPVAFPTNCFAVTFGGLYASGALIPTLDSTPTKTGFTASTYLVSGSRTNQAAYWEAIGN